jgi:hypothetical protein
MKGGITEMEDIDDFESEQEEFEQEEKVEKKKKVKKVEVQQENEEEPLERYIAFNQPARIGIIDTITKEVIADGFENVSIANLEAFKLNKLEKIGIVTGVD